LGWLTQRQGDTERAEATYEEMLELSRKLDDEANVATALNSLGTLAVQQGDHERATPLLEENLAVLRRLEERGDTTTPLKSSTCSVCKGIWHYLTVTSYGRRRCGKKA
jgi:tetratricopeptide (TPR) repeat protein